MSFTPKKETKDWTAPITIDREPKFEKANWLQVIRDKQTNNILAEYSPGKHLSPIALKDRFGEFWESMRRI